VSRLYPALDVVWPLQPDDERIDLLLAEVDDEGPLAVETIDSGMRLFFPTGLARGRAAVKLIALEPDLTCTPQEIPDEDWAARSQASLGPITVGRLLIVPPWLADTDDAGGCCITIQPSMGFGTGHHASTRLCLRLLQDIPASGSAVLDVGTGSGVLAIAASKLGAALVLAIDNDEDALASARENIDLNRAAVATELAELETPRPAHTFDIVLANLTGALLIRQASPLAALLNTGGALIVSGVTDAESADVKSAFAIAGLVVDREASEDGWTGLRLTQSEGSRVTSPRPPTTR
jgi:ribosomal protein L11 methyltransferase